MRPLSLSILCLAFCAGCVSPLPGLEAPQGPAGPALALAPLKVTYVPTLDRPTSDTIGSWQHVVCARCQEELEAEEGERKASCPECHHGEVREPFAPPFEPRLATEVAEDRWVELLRERATFASITRLEPGDREALFAGAEAGGAKWLLEVELADLRARLIEKNGWQVPKIITFIVCALLIFPAIDPPNWFIPGEDYGIEASLRWRLWDVEEEKRLAAGQEDVLVALDAFAAFGLGSIPGRPFFFAGFLRTPGCLDEEDWEVIADQLQEQAEQGLTNELVRLTEKRRQSAK